MTTEIPLCGGLTAIVDDCDAQLVQSFKWHALKDRRHHTVYARAYVPGSCPQRKIMMHRLILDAPSNADVDHENRNGLDNRRQNLRRSTVQQNMRNAAKHLHHRGKPTHSRYKGVSWHKSRWIAEICSAGKKKWIGTFHSEQEAALAYNREAVVAFGEFARLNEL